MVINRVVVGSTVVRFFHERRDAINAANALTASFQEQHNAVSTENGWLIENAVTKRLRDSDGLLPEGLNVGKVRR